MCEAHRALYVRYIKTHHYLPGYGLLNICYTVHNDKSIKKHCILFPRQIGVTLPTQPLGTFQYPARKTC